MLDLNLAKAKELIEASIEERGEDYVYPYSNCVYVLDNSGYVDGKSFACVKGPRAADREEDIIKEPTVGCGVGLALFKGGIPMSAMISQDGGAYSILSALGDRGFLRATGAARSLLQGFQIRQDDGFEWGVAYADALEDAESGFDRWGDLTSTDDVEWLEG
jgi:hypothetical protein